MRTDKILTGIVFAALCGGIASGQAKSSASQELQLSAWGGVGGAIVGINDGRNISISAGGDATIRPYFFHISPSLEVRGTYPVYKGVTAGEKSILAGLKFEKHFGNLHPYADVLFGRGELDYVTPLPNQADTFFYIQTTSNVLSPGIGVDYSVTHHIALKADVQLQRWSSPVTVNGHFWATPFAAAVIYNFDFNHHYRQQR